MAESVEGMEYVDDAVRDESEISVSIRTPQDIRKVSVCRTGTVKQVAVDSVLTEPAVASAGPDY